MDGDNNPDRLVQDPPEFPSEQRERTGSMSLGAPPIADDVSPINGDGANSTAVSPPVQDPNAKLVHDVVNSEVSINSIDTLWVGSGLIVR